MTIKLRDANYTPGLFSLGMVLILTTMFLVNPAFANKKSAEIITLDNKELQKLDTFEGHEINKADKAFNTGKYAQAAVEYDSFILQFPESNIIAYALFRKGRSLQLARKRFNAIKEYREVLDYFPNNVKYAAAAMYYWGNCHWENGDEDDAMKVWAQLARDKQYSRQPIAADAINRLAEYMRKKKRVDEAMKYYWQVAKDFRTANQKAAEQAMWKVIPYYIREDMNEEKLREFYTDIRGFDPRRPRSEMPKDVSMDKAYWGLVKSRIRDYGKFDSLQTDQRKEYYGYWADKMKGRFSDWDSYQIDRLRFQYLADGNKTAWIKALDDQFTKNGSTTKVNRIIQFLAAFQGHKPKVQEYYGKLPFKSMSWGQIYQVIKVLSEQINEIDIAKGAYAKFPWSKMSDQQIIEVGYYATRYRDDNLVERIYGRTEDKMLGLLQVLRYYHRNRNPEKGIPVADEVATEPDYAKEALFKKGELLMRQGKYNDAIAAFKLADNPPENLIQIAQCYAKLNKLPQAVSQYREIENFFKDRAPWASLQIADLYRRADMKPQYIKELRKINRVYKKTSQASEAHQRLEKMGYKTGGGSDE